jgi:hypothetical protein
VLSSAALSALALTAEKSMPNAQEAQARHEAQKPTWIELESVIPLPEAARLKSVSVDTLKRRYAHLIIHLSPRRRGMKLKHALGLEQAHEPSWAGPKDATGDEKCRVIPTPK